MSECDIFLAVAYGPACKEGSEYRRAIEAIVAVSNSAGVKIYVAPANESWGRERPARKQAIETDHAALRQCTCFVYFAGGFDSDGILVELGMAVALRKRIVVLRSDCEELPSHVRGFIDIGIAEECVLPQLGKVEQIWHDCVLAHRSGVQAGGEAGLHGEQEKLIAPTVASGRGVARGPHSSQMASVPDGEP